MKHIVAAVGILLCCSSCLYLDESCSLGKTRSESMDGMPEMTRTQETGDTTVYVCAVEFPQGYDWQKDTAMGIGEGRLLFYENHLLKYDLSVGYDNCVSSDADTHHIIDGNLFTEFSTASETVILKNGKELLRYPSREYLLGLFEKNGFTYTLGRNRADGEMVFRRDGQVLIRSPGAVPFGSFQEPSYPQTGALYESDGKMCFSYKIKTAGSWVVHVVEDENDIFLSPSPLFGGGIQDVKVIDGQAVMVAPAVLSGFYLGTAQMPEKYGEGQQWSNLRLQPTPKYRYAVFGTYQRPLFNGTMVFSPEQELAGLGSDDCVCLVDGNAVMLCDVQQDGLCMNSKNTIASLGWTVIRACTPKDVSLGPYLMIGEKKIEYRLNGYFSGIAVTVSQSR